jgi:transposase
MDTSPQVDTTTGTDSQDAPTIRRRHRSVEEKRRIVEKTLVKGASVARVAREHGVNANEVFSWRLLHKKGRLGGRATKLLPATAADTARTKQGEQRRWSLEVKQQIVAASLVPGACVKEIAQAQYSWPGRESRAHRLPSPQLQVLELLVLCSQEGQEVQACDTRSRRKAYLRFGHRKHRPDCWEFLWWDSELTGRRVRPVLLAGVWYRARELRDGEKGG